MNDLISRLAAIEAIKNCESEECFEYNEGLMAAMNAVVDVPSAQEWIPCSERLPDDGQWVLVWGHGQRLPIMMFRESGAWIDDQFEFHTTVTHWMPLPKPPKEVKA